MELRQQQKLGQSLVMTPQLQQAIKLLQLSHLELISTIEQELCENPLLEETSGDENPNRTENQEITFDDQDSLSAQTTDPIKNNRTGDEQQAVESMDWESYYESQQFALPPSAKLHQSDEYDPSFYENVLVEQQSLHDHLLWQINMSHFDQQERRIAERLIGEIDDNGYLPEDVTQIITKEQQTEEFQVEQILRRIQLFDPVGVGARNLKECLLIQAIALGHDHDLVYRLIDEFLPDIEKRQLAVVAKNTKHPLEIIIEAFKIIERMNPKPGKQIGTQQTEYVVPDVFIIKVGQEFKIFLNEDGLPKLKIQQDYKQKTNTLKGNDKVFLQDKYRQAVSLIRSVQQRQRTIYRVMESILKFQKDFFEQGTNHLKPLVLKQVADDLGLHESTISRVTSHKFVHTPMGVFEFKYFFNSAIHSTEGEDVSSQSVKQRLEAIIAGESPKKPYSDQELVEMMKKNYQIDVARRTVAKYREAMGILPSSKRKKLY